MQIILKETPESNVSYCLFDTRSEKFLVGGGVKNPEDSELLDIANNLVQKSPRTIYTIAQNREYIDGEGYTEALIAERYLQINPDLVQRAKELIAEKPQKKTRKRKEKPEVIDELTGEVIPAKEDKPKGKPGRPKRIWTDAEIEAKSNAPKRGKGRPKKENQGPKTIVLVDGVPRKRGRPSKASLATLSVMTI